jgi:hypothetical protein
MLTPVAEANNLEALVIPRSAEIHPDEVSPADAVVIVRGIGQVMIERVWTIFRGSTTRAAVLERLSSGPTTGLSDADCRRLMLAAEARNMRLTTFILLILRSITFVDA